MCYVTNVMYLTRNSCTEWLYAINHSAQELYNYSCAEWLYAINHSAQELYDYSCAEWLYVIYHSAQELYDYSCAKWLYVINHSAQELYDYSQRENRETQRKLLHSDKDKIQSVNKLFGIVVIIHLWSKEFHSSSKIKFYIK